MTLLVALKAADGLVMAADSRGTFGDPRQVTAQNDSQQKAHILADHVAVLQAGAGELGTHVVERAKQVLKGELMTVPVTPGAPPVLQPGNGVPPATDGVTPVMGVLRDVTRASYNEWFPSVEPVPPPMLAAQGQVPTRPELQFIVGGYEVGGGGANDARIYTMLSAVDFAPALHDYGFAVGGIPTYALYLLNRLYQPGRSTDDLAALAVYVITETASQDGKVGGPVNLVKVTPTAGCQLLTAEQVQAIVADNTSRSEALRDSFYEHGDGE